MSERARIKPGERVRWSSTSNGRRDTKEGDVLAFLPAHTSNAWARVPAGTKRSRLRVQPSTEVSSVDRYLVRVSGYYYAPLAGVVERQNPNAAREP